MPVRIDIKRIEIDLTQVTDQEDRDYALHALPSEGDEDHSVDTLSQLLCQVAERVPGLRVVVRYKFEYARGDYALQLEHGRTFAVPLKRGPMPEPVPAATCSPSYQALLDAEALAQGAAEEDTTQAWLSVLDHPGALGPHTERHPGFVARRRDQLRAHCWRALERCARPDLTLERVLRAVDEENDTVREALAYRLCAFGHLEAGLREALARATPASRERLDRCLREWPDFFPPSPPAAEPPVNLAPGIGRLEKQLRAVLPTLSSPKVFGFRKLLRELSQAPQDVLPVFLDLAVPLLLQPPPSEPRALGLSLEILLYAGAVEEDLLPFAAPLPDCAAKRALACGRVGEGVLAWPSQLPSGAELRRGTRTYRASDRSLTLCGESGEVEGSWTIPFAPTVALIDRGPRGVLAWDGRFAFGAPMDSGLLVDDDGSAQELLPAVLSVDADAAAERRATQPGPRATTWSGFSRSPHEEIVRGVTFDLANLDPSERGLVELELHALRDARGDLNQTLLAIARSFFAAEAWVVSERRSGGQRSLYRVERGKVRSDDELRGRADAPTYDAVIQGDALAVPSSVQLDEPAAGLFAARRAVAAALDTGVSVWSALLDPRLYPASPALLVRLAARHRTTLHEAFAGTGVMPDTPMLLRLLAAEPDEKVAERLCQLWRERAQHDPASRAAYLAAEEPRFKARLRELLGHVAADCDRVGRIQRILARATPPPADVDSAAIATLLQLAPLPEPKKTTRRPTKAEATALKEVEARAESARGDLFEMLELLDHPTLASPLAAGRRVSLWSKIMEMERPSLRFARVLTALHVESGAVADVITYKLYLQRRMASDVGAALLQADALGEPAARLRNRLVRAIHEWPDFPASAAVAVALAKPRVQPDP